MSVKQYFGENEVMLGSGLDLSRKKQQHYSKEDQLEVSYG